MGTKKRVLVGMSGGIDSSATCMMLQEQGYEVVGMTMRVWDARSKFSTPDQLYPDFILEAQALAKRLNITHIVVDERTEFKATVVDNFIQEYLKGRTPNPCVMCNPHFKFRLLVETANAHQCDYIATGHYSRIEQEDGKYYIVMGNDDKKDQSYFLWALSQEVLSRILFPLGALTKIQVREYLHQKGYEAKAAGPESMEVCFVEGDYRDFITEQLPDVDQKVVQGSFVNAQGVKLGSHKGVAFYTVGQRKGLDIALGYPAYVLKLNAEKNTVMLGTKEELESRYMLVEKCNLVDESRFFANHEIEVRIRYRSKPIPCTVQKMDDGRLLVQFKQIASAITPGQSAVFYHQNRVLGGGLIGSQRGIGEFEHLIPLVEL